MLNNIRSKIKNKGFSNLISKNTTEKIIDSNISEKKLDVSYQVSESFNYGPPVSPIGDNVSLIKHFTDYSYKVKLKGNDVDGFLEWLLLEVLKEINIYEPKNEYVKMSIPYLRRILESICYRNNAEIIRYLIEKYELTHVFIDEFLEIEVRSFIKDLILYLKSFNLNHPNDLLLGEMNLNRQVQYKLERYGIYTLSELQKFVRGEKRHYMVSSDPNKQCRFIEELNEYYNTLKDRESLILDLDKEQRKYLQRVLHTYKDSRSRGIGSFLI